jgi:hypothetical protein
MDRCNDWRLSTISTNIESKEGRNKPYSTYGRDTRTKSDKRKHEGEVKTIFIQSNANLHKAYAQYINASRKIILRTATKLDGKVPHDNFYCIMNTHLKGLVNQHFIYECFEEYRKKKREHGKWPN